MTAFIYFSEIFTFISIFKILHIYLLLSPPAGLGDKIQVFSKNKNLSVHVYIIAFENGGTLVRPENGNDRYHRPLLIWEGHIF